MGAQSAGLLLYRIAAGGVVEVLIAHPGGPFWARKGDGSWSIPKGEYDESEDPLAAAFREFAEETGLELPRHDAVSLGELRQPSGKRVMVWALEADLDVTQASSNTFAARMAEWVREGQGVPRGGPPRVGHRSASPGNRLLKGQVPFLDRLQEAIGVGGGTGGAHRVRRTGLEIDRSPWSRTTPARPRGASAAAVRITARISTFGSIIGVAGGGPKKRSDVLGPTAFGGRHGRRHDDAGAGPATPASVLRAGLDLRRPGRRRSSQRGAAARAQQPAFYWASLAVLVACALSLLLPWERFPAGPSSSPLWATSCRSCSC